MYNFIPCLLLLILFIYLFFREVKLDYEKFLEADKQGDEHVLKEVERFLKERHHKNSEFNHEV